MRKPKIISIAGLDGSGKTTQINHLKDYFDSQNKKTEILKVKYNPYHKYRKDCDLLNVDLLRKMMAMEFVHYYNEKIKEYNNYDYLLCDRSKADLIAYGLTYGLKNPDEIYNLLKLTPNPDLLFYFAIEPEMAFERIKERSENLDEFETLENLKRDRMNFSKVFQSYDYNPIYIDANKDEETVTKKLIKTINETK